MYIYMLLCVRVYVFERERERERERHCLVSEILEVEGPMKCRVSFSVGLVHINVCLKKQLNDRDITSLQQAAKSIII